MCVSSYLSVLLSFDCCCFFIKGGSKYFLFGLVKLRAGPNDILLVLNGDDSLYRTDALKLVNQQYLESGAFFTYGSHEGHLADQTKNFPPGIRIEKNIFKPRIQTWIYGHPHTFKAHLLDHISKQDFQQSDGSWLMQFTERGFVYRMLELAGPRRIGYIQEKIYRYKYSDKSSTVALISANKLAEILNYTMYEMKPSKELALEIHVVLLVWKRIYLLYSQMIWIQRQVNLGNRRIHLHIVNNNEAESKEVNRVTNKFNMRQWDGIRDSHTEGKPALGVKVTVTHNPSDQLNHNFARFVYVNDLRRHKPIDEIIFLDDDQYWPPTFLSNLLKAHRPKSISTWYGKTFLNQDIGHGDSTYSYWKPDFSLTDLIAGKSKLQYFKYGGTGGSIFDANLWLLESQLLRLARGGDLHHWARIDDLWASYVLDALLGWDIRRISSDVIPIDIGDFFKKKRHGTNYIDKKFIVRLKENFSVCLSPQMPPVYW